MDMNDPLRREEKKESAPDRQDSGPKGPDVCQNDKQPSISQNTLNV